MTPEQQVDRLRALLAAFFREARAEQQRSKLEKRGSEHGKSPQSVHPFDRVIDVVCTDLGLPNPGTDRHSIACYPHPIDGWPPEEAERMRRMRVRLGHEKSAKGPGEDEWLDRDWLRVEGYYVSKSGWARKGAPREEEDEIEDSEH